MIRKYWKLTTLVIVIFAAVTVFYIKSTKISDGFPQFTWKQVEGDAEASDAMTIEGNLQFSMADSESFKATAKDGTSYLKDESFFKRLQGFYNSEKYEQRKKEYRSFMRGKADDDMLYAEDEHRLAYATTDYGGVLSEPLLHIDVLDKGSGDRTQMKLPFNQVGAAGYMDIVAVKFADNQLALIMESDNEEVSQYTINLEAEKISKKEKIYTIGADSRNSDSSMHYLFNEQHPEKEMMLVEERNSYDSESGETEETTIDHTGVYDLKTNEEKKIEIPKDKGRPVSYDNDAVYLSKLNEKGLTLSLYDRKQGKVTEKLPIKLEVPTEADSEADVQYIIQQRKLYITVNYYTSISQAYPQVMVVDLSNMELSYQGKLVSDQKQRMGENEDQYINFDQMEVNTRER